MATDDLQSLVFEVDDFGKLVIDDNNREPFRMMFLRHAGEKIVLYVKRWRNKLSKKQRGYYFAVVVPMIGDAMGESDPDEVHEALKVQCNPKILVGKDDQEARVGSSTKNFDTKEMHEYIERCRHFASSFYGIDIPDPQRVMYDGAGI